MKGLFLGIFQCWSISRYFRDETQSFSHPTEVNVVFKDERGNFRKLLESQKIIDILDDIDYDTQEMQTILSRNLPSETYEILKKYLDDNSYLKTIWSYYDD